MTATDPLFSGGGASNNPNVPPSAPTGALKIFFDMFTDRATPKYMVGPEGSQVLMSFAPTGILTITNGATVTEMPFKRI